MKIVIPKVRVAKFKDMALAPELLTAIAKLGFSKPTTIQSQTVPVGIEGHDLIAVAQTGSGKTLAFALALLTRISQSNSSRALILTPTREMAQQTYRVFLELCRELPISNCLLIGGVPTAKQLNQLRKNPRLIIATPGRMIDHLQGNKLLLQNVEIVVIDEADRMLDMGFAPQLKIIQNTLRGLKQTMMFSASFARTVEAMAALFMKNEVMMIRSAQAEAPVASLKQEIIRLEPSEKGHRLLDELNATKGSVLIFTSTQESCEHVGQHLKEYGYSSDWIHGNQTQGQRNRVVKNFREGSLRILVSTDLLARGVDFPQVELVINYDLPYQPEDFLHRIGRTARAGRGGRAMTFITPGDLRKFEKIKSYLPMT